MRRFKAVIRLIKERLEALSLRRGIAAICILTAVTMFSFAAPFALNFSYAETSADEPSASQEEGKLGEGTGAGNETPNNTGSTSNGATGEEGTAEGGEDPQAETKTDAENLRELLINNGAETVTLSSNKETIEYIKSPNPDKTLIILSNSGARLYQNATIETSFSGDFSIADSITVNDKTMSFIGLGSDEFPYAGNFVCDKRIALSRPLFNNVRYSDNIVDKGEGSEYDQYYNLQWEGKSSEAIAASNVSVEESVSQPFRLKVNITVITKKSGETNSVLYSPVLGDVDGNISIVATFSKENGEKIITEICQSEKDVNAGLIANSFHNGLMSVDISGIDFSEMSITSTKANAGLLVGKVYTYVAPEAAENTEGHRSENGNEQNESEQNTLAEGTGNESQAKEPITTTLEIKSDISIPKSGSKVSINAGFSAGGLVGSIEDATLKIDSDKSINISGVSVNGQTAGGIVGSSVEANYSIADGSTIKPALTVGAVDATIPHAGGLFGVYETSSNIEFPIDRFDLTNAFTLEAKGQTAENDPPKGAAGGFAGKVVLNNGGSLKISMKDSAPPASEETNNSSPEGEGEAQTLSERENSSETNNSESMTSEPEGSGIIESITSLAEGSTRLQSVLSSASDVEAYGGVIGAVEGAENLGTNVKLENMTVLAESAENSKALYKSGMVAIVGGVDKPTALVVSKMTAQMKNANSSNEATGAFGGAAAKLGKGSVIYQAGDFEISTSGNSVNAGGGLVGIAEVESAVRLTGTTDISGVSFTGTSLRIGQLVGVQDSALIYAEGSGSDDGWKYVRKGDVKFDDIGSYGQVYRLHADGLTPRLITMADSGDNPTYKVGFSNKTAYSEGEVSLGSKDDLAKLAITIQTRGHFSGYDGIDTVSWNGLLDDNLTVTTDINLAGTGVTGITRDSIGAEEIPDAFTGSIDGGGHYIALSAGEAYGDEKQVIGSSHVNSAECCGLVYRHNRLGLFSYGNGSAKDLTIKGSISFEALEAGIAAGAYSACSNGGDNKIFTRCSFEPKITYKTNEKLCYVGGVIGMLDGNAENLTKFTEGTTIAPTINIDAVTKNGVDVTGGAIGYVGSSCPAEIKSDNTTLSADISNKNNTYTTSLAGGYIGIIMPSATTNYNRVSVTFNDTKMDGHKVSLKANTATGGLLGYMWADTNVSFTGDAASFGLSVNDTGTNKTLLNAETNTAGGLVYRASGKWTVDDKGINLGGAKISGVKTSLGLLVCRGTNGGEKIGGSNVDSAALYLKLTAPWNNAYPLSSETSDEGYVDISCSPGTFDEFVAFSKSEQDSFANNVSGVISLQTANDEKKVIMDGIDINTYINRSYYGLNHKTTNGWSRYYYNLDMAIKSIDSGNGVIDTPEELLVWSVGIYAGTNIKQCFEVNDTKSTGITKTTIGSKDDNVVSLDMRGYSYYPVTINNRSINIKKAKIVFHNKEIEVSENKKKNKNTSGSTQHYAMHCGLFRDFNNSSSVEGDYSISCQELTLSGSVGMIGETSGALISGTVEGFESLSPNMYSVDLDEISLNRLVVDGISSSTEYAPLLINQSGSYSSIIINNLAYVNEGAAQIAGTSLVGNVGKCDSSGKPESTQISVTFNRVSVPSSNNDVFTKASLLNSFSFEAKYGVGSAVYNFTQEDEADKYITYGKEIDSTEEYKGLQLYYFDSNVKVKNESSKEADEDNPAFKDYLPYVLKKYDEGSGYHEIAVNQKFSDILKGCGTYMDPFVISDADQLISVAKFINNFGSGAGMSIAIARSQSTPCDKSESKHVIYQKNGGKWISEDGTSVTNNTMHRYMQSAYYFISTDIELSNGFQGIGNTSNPFRGVITGRLDNTKPVNKITITSSSLMGFIPCSYGSVIKDLEIEYKGNDNIRNNTINYMCPEKNDYSPKSYFGGVIGLILGGDNIIDNVTVGMNGDYPLKLNLKGDKRHLIPTGGYIGAISGGGVIFRNTQVNSESGGLSNEWLDNTQIADLNKHLKVDEAAKNSLYVNPVIGRVISGYAFSEGCKLYNTNKNYSINSISKNSLNEKDIVTGKIAQTNAAETTVNSAQGLMILSAIIQSGAGAGHINNRNICGTLPYYGIEEIESDGFHFGNGKYGKVRNASYKYIGGKPDDENSQTDFNISLIDDMHAPGLYNTNNKTSQSDLLALVNTSEDINSPYLVKNYATKQTEFICASYVSLMRLKLKADESFDMTRYGPAYVGLTGRYKSNSVQTDGANAIDRTVPFIICVSGNNYGKDKNCSLSVNMNIYEYSDDDFRSAGAGALFSTAYWYYNSKEAAEGLKNNNYNAISGINLKDSTIGIHYFDVNRGTEVEDADALIRGASVGGLIGNMNSYSTGTKYQTALISDVSVSRVTVYSPYAAGSIIGSAGNKSRDFSDDNYHTIGKDSANLYYHLIDCTYDSIDIYGAKFAGGFVGFSNPKDKTTANGLDVTREGTVTGRDSIIRSSLSFGLSGGIIGYQQGTFGLNDPDYKAVDSDGSTYYSSGDKSLRTAALSNVDISGNIIGGFVGEVENTVTVKNALFTDNPSDNSEGLKGKDCIGGVVGRTTENKKTSGHTFDRISIIGVNFTSSGSNNGGIIGHLQNNSTANETLSITNSEVSGCSFSRAEGAPTAGATSGGAIGTVADTNVRTVVRNFVSSDNSFVGANSSGFIGSASGNIDGCNILISGNSLTNASSGGHLYGSIQSGAKTRIAGLSVKLKPEETSEESKKLIGVDNAGVLAENDTSSYIAFADYTGEASSSVASKTLLDATQEYPYVTTSPISSISVKNSESESRFLFGDGIGTVNEYGEPVVTARTILDEIGTSDNNTRFKYGNSKSAKFNFESQLSTLKKNNEDAGIIDDIPVVRVAGGDTSGIEGYLDIITNGGYSKAKKVNAQENNTVTADVNVYKWDSNLNAFVVSNDNPSIVVKNNGSSDMGFRSTTEYDNDMKKFSLVTVTFNEAGSVYKIHVPVLVRRVLEIDFTATLNYGTSFTEEAYKRLGRGAHVLESFGNPVTALITFKYNSAYRVDTEYGWTTYLDAGGSMREVEKTISFVDGETDNKRIPKGTKLSLVDCTDAKVYTTTYDGSGSVGLSSFKDSAGNNYKNKWLSTLMNVKASRPITDGKWVKCAENDVDAVADVLGQKYKLASSDELKDSNIDKYNLYVGENGTAEEPHPEESFYLVINVPLNDNTKDITANGYVSGKAKCGSIPINMNYTLRYDETNDPAIKYKDNHLNTASTYSFLSGYTQTIADNSSDKVAGKKVVPKQKPDYAGRFFDINLKDTITFNSSQVYNDNDSLFYKLSVNLHNVQGSAETTSYFASGTEGEAKIYVKIGENNYIYNGSNWEESQSEPASTFAWKAEDNNGKLELVLCDSYGKAIDLAGIRKIAKNSGKNSFTISTKMEMHMSEDAFNESIMSSVSKDTDNYSQFYYRCMLATRAEALDYSSNSETCAGDVHYYQEKLGKSRITYSANDIKQLGINCSDLNTADGSIETTGSYILEDVSQNKGLIERANAIKYSLRLYKKKNDENGRYELVKDPEEYIEVKGRSSKLAELGSLGEPEIVNEPSGNYFVWTDNKSDGVFKTQDGLRRFTINISVKVKTDNVEEKEHFYSNYRLVLTAEMFESSERIDYPVNSRIGTDYVEDDNLDSHSDYVTYSLTRIATDDFLGLNTQQ